MKLTRQIAGVALTLLVLGACAGEMNTPGEALRLLNPNMEPAFTGEEYRETLRPAGGLRPYSFRLEGGTLPPGLELEGNLITGVPTQVGNYTFTISVSDANLSSTFLEHRLRVSEVPPPSLTVSVPSTQVRAPVTVRVGVSDARRLAGLSTRLTWDHRRFDLVDGSIEQQVAGVALFTDSGPGWLQADLAWLAGNYEGERTLFTFQLSPRDVYVPGLEFVTEFMSESAHGFTVAEGRAGERLREVPPPDAAPPDAGDADGVPDPGEAQQGDDAGGSGSDADGSEAASDTDDAAQDAAEEPR